MRRICVCLAVAAVALPLLAQTPSKPRPPYVQPLVRAEAIEGAIKQASTQLEQFRKVFENDIEILAHIRASDAALADAMQPMTSVETAWKEMNEANRLNPPFEVGQGVAKSLQLLDDARRSPTSADFGHIRSVIREWALGPASRRVVANAQRLEDSMTEWIKIQQMIGDHVRLMNDIAGRSLRASLQ